MHISEMQQAAFEMVQFADPAAGLEDHVQGVTTRLVLARSCGLDVTRLADDLATIVVSVAQISNKYGIALHEAVLARLIRGGYVPETATRVAGTQSITEATARAGEGSTAAEQGAGEAKEMTGGSGG